MRMSKYIVLAFLLICGYSYSCTPVPPEVIPPNEVGGEFTYVYPTEADEIRRVIDSRTDLAVVRVISDEQIDNMWVARIQLLYGWGYQKSRYVDYVRVEDTCGKPELLDSRQRYFAVLDEGEVKSTYSFTVAESLLTKLGEPRYRYSNAGLTINAHNK